MRGDYAMDRTNPLGREITRSLYMLGKNQKWLAGEIGITEGMISSIVTGRSRPSQKTLLKLSKTLPLSAEKLVECLFGSV